MDSTYLPGSLKTHGLKIHLYRRPLGLVDNLYQSPSVDFLIWGYYDWASLRWDGDSLLNYYVPPNEGRAKEDPGSDQGNLPDAEITSYEDQKLCAFTYEERRVATESKFPLIVITEIKLDNDYLRQRKQDPSQNLMEYIKNQVDDFLIEKQDPNVWEYQALFSLGFNEVMIIFRCSSYQPILAAVEAMKSQLCENSQRMVLSTYSVYGIEKNALAMWREQEMKRASVFVSLKACVSRLELKQEIIKNLQQMMDEPIPGDCVDIDLLFGKYDAEISFMKLPVQVIAGLFAENGLFDSHHSFFKQYVQFTRTRWFYQDNRSESLSLQTPGQKCAPTNQEVIIDSAFQKGLYKSSDLIVHENVERGGLYPFWSGLYDIIDDYCQIEYNASISRFLRTELKSLLVTLITVIGNDMQCVVTSDGPEKLPVFDQDQTKQIRKCEKNSFELAIHLFSELLQNWVQTNRNVMEGPLYNIQFVNGSTKIYIAYYSLIETLEKELSDHYIDPHQPRPNFFAVIHHADEIKSQFLFPTTPSSQWLIPIRLDKESFFSPFECIPYLGHEIGHYIYPNVVFRNKVIIRSVCQLIARKIFLQVTIESKSSYLLRRIQEIWGEAHDWAINELCDRLYGVLKKYFTACETNARETKKFNIKEPNYMIFSIKLGNLLKAAFDPLGVRGYEAIQQMEQQAEPYLSSLLDLKDDCWTRRKEKIENLLNDLIDVLRQDKISELPLLKAVLFDELRNSNSPASLIQAVETVIAEYMQRHEEKNRFFGELSEICLHCLSEESPLQPERSLIEHLTNPVETTPNERKRFASIIAENKIYENTRENRAILSEHIAKFFHTTDFSKDIQYMIDLLIETSADLFMIQLLGISKDRYQEIVKRKASDPIRVPRHFSGFEPDMEDNHANSVRMDIILNHWDAENALTFDPRSRDYDSDGIDYQYHLHYLIWISKKIAQFTQHSRIQSLQNAYHQVAKHAGAHDEMKLGSEIEFILKYCMETL
jgi:hypothetical protein